MARATLTRFAQCRRFRNSPTPCRRAERSSSWAEAGRRDPGSEPSIASSTIPNPGCGGSCGGPNCWKRRRHRGLRPDTTRHRGDTSHGTLAAHRWWSAESDGAQRNTRACSDAGNGGRLDRSALRSGRQCETGWAGLGSLRRAWLNQGRPTGRENRRRSVVVTQEKGRDETLL